ncbi:MAG: potassium-transporting ATPase subunit KdpA, partial [Clostridiales bacterium]|nr:potassium-transporting ATPase subunit KdpA [Clostridiales bacterium]
MGHILIQDIIFIILLIGLSIPLGLYIYNIMEGRKVFLTGVFGRAEKLLYKYTGTEDMGPKKYLASILMFSGIGFLVLFLLLMLQSGMNWSLAFNTAASFVSNTNWQAYSNVSN